MSQFTNIESDGNLYMASKPEGNEITYGPKEFFYNVKSRISLNEVKFNEKENVELFNKLAEKFTLINSEVLLQSIKDSKEEKNKEKQVEVKEETKQLRKLFDISASKSMKLISFNVLSQKISVGYAAGISESSAFNKIVIESGLGKFEFGMTRCTQEKENDSEKYEQTIFEFPVPLPFPFSLIRVGCYVTGLSFGIGRDSGEKEKSVYWAKLAGNLSMRAKVGAGIKKIASVEVFAEGTIIEASGQVNITQGSIKPGLGFGFSAGKIDVGVKAEALFMEGKWSATLFKGWKLDINF